MASEHELQAMQAADRFERWLRTASNDLATLLGFRAFCTLFTSGCLLVDRWQDPPAYRASRSVDRSILRPEEQIVLDCARWSKDLVRLLTKAAKRIRHTVAGSDRTATETEAGVVAQLRDTLADALRYEPPVSSCSV